MSIGCKRYVLAAFIALAGVANSGVASATTMVELSEQDLAHMADVIAIATVDRVQPEVTLTRAGERVGRMVNTRTDLLVVDAWKGPYKAGDRLTVRAIGGIAEGQRVEVDGAPGFLTGERVLVYLQFKPATADFGVIGWSQGKFTLYPNGAGGWTVGRTRLTVDDWGKAFDAAKFPSRIERGADLASVSMRVKRVVEADAEANVNWRELPQMKARGLR